uniref:PDZ domain-containing protein n=1 Tax=Paramormyrops kingsleyae TaxID=1676925 RepID=A0A3B3RT56_9TELE
MNTLLLKSTQILTNRYDHPESLRAVAFDSKERASYLCMNSLPSITEHFQAEEDIYDPYHKSSSIKKGKRIGFGSFFEKRSSAKISQMEDPEGSESRVFVRTVKKAASEGLVVSGGGKEGIFIKEVKPDSPASKHLTVKEGDQILSATVYFDNISYEDALQILKHAQAYRMEMCLKRKRPASTVSTLERTTDVQPDVRYV